MRVVIFWRGVLEKFSFGWAVRFSFSFVLVSEFWLRFTGCS